MNVALPFGIDQEFKEITGRNIVQVLKENGPRHHVQFIPTNGALRLKWEAVQKLFDPVVEQVLQAIENVDSAVLFRRFSYLLLVGGFAESLYMQQAIKNRFSQRTTVLVPEQPQLAIIRGAVRYGHQPEEVKSRISKFSYG